MSIKKQFDLIKIFSATLICLLFLTFPGTRLAVHVLSLPISSPTTETITVQPHTISPLQASSASLPDSPPSSPHGCCFTPFSPFTVSPTPLLSSLFSPQIPILAVQLFSLSLLLLTLYQTLSLYSLTTPQFSLVGIVVKRE